MHSKLLLSLLMVPLSLIQQCSHLVTSLQGSAGIPVPAGRVRVGWTVNGCGSGWVKANGYGIYSGLPVKKNQLLAQKDIYNQLTIRFKS